MATLTTKRKFTIVDLVRYKPMRPDLVVPATRIDMEIEVETKGLIKASPVPTAAMERLENAARAALDKYEKTITEVIKPFDETLTKYLIVEDLPEVQKMLAKVPDLNMSVKNALATAKAAAEEAVKERLAVEAKADTNLKESKFKLAYHAVVGIITVSGNIAKLVGSGGLDLKSYVNIGKTLVTNSMDLYNFFKGEEKKREDLEKATKAYLELRTNGLQLEIEKVGVAKDGFEFTSPIKSFKKLFEAVKGAGENLLKGRTALQVVEEVKNNLVAQVKAKLNDMEKSRVNYRDHVTKTRHKVDACSKEADKLMQLMKTATTLKIGVAFGAQYMQQKQRVTVLALKLDDREKVLQEFEGLMKDFGLTVDDTPFIEKLKRLDPASLKDVMEGVKMFADEVKEFVEALV